MQTRRYTAEKVLNMALSSSAYSQGMVIVCSYAPELHRSQLPFALVLELAAQCEYAAQRGVALRAIRVSPRWINVVAQASHLTQEGLALLGAHLAENGYLTLFDALEWLALEVKANTAYCDSEKEDAGTFVLMERALREAAHLLDEPLRKKAALAKQWAERHARLGRRGRRRLRHPTVM